MLFKKLRGARLSQEAESDSTDDTSTVYDVAAEKRALRKVDWHIVPLIFLIYMFSFLDR